mmetsp:Transcript_29829/g.84078  ORF Transcript_29829/g.84078 Transcript_29829/m.84078 type:complete len:81 (+) Transcript_29829:559-801(+)
MPPMAMAILKPTVYAPTLHQNAIRKKTEQINYLRLASRLDAVVSRLDTQAKMNMVNKNMAGIVKTLEKTLNSQNLEKVIL